MIAPALACALSLLAVDPAGDPNASATPDTGAAAGALWLSPITILGQADTQGIAGSAHRLDEVALETFEYNDAHQTLRQVPGVYVRDE
ncbi:MAG TPA: hypothetical protein VFH51_03110, partial [Myxococcota bacterium]|nr:hypothetical protein [Myxococcota bacterium]